MTPITKESVIHGSTGYQPYSLIPLSVDAMDNIHNDDIELGNQAPHHGKGSPHRGAQRTYTKNKSNHSSDKGSGSRPSSRQGVALSIVKKSLRSHVDSDLTVGVGGRAARSSNDPTEQVGIPVVTENLRGTTISIAT